MTKSFLGKGLTIIWGLLSIPMSTISVVFCGRFIASVTKLGIVTFETKILKRQSIHNLCKKLIGIQILLNILSGLIYSVIVNEMIFPDRHFLDSIYFVFVTISTIGFGDLSYDAYKVVKKFGAEEVILAISEFIVFYVSFSILASLIDTMVSHDTSLSWKSMKKGNKPKANMGNEEKVR